MGEHCLTNLNLAHALFKKEEEFAEAPFTKQDKLDILEFIECLPTRKAKSILLRYSSVPGEMAKDKRYDLSLDELVNNEKIQNKLTKLKGLLAHSEPNLSTIDLINKLCDLGINQWDPAKRVSRKPKVQMRSSPNQNKISAAPRIPTLVKQLVWQKAQSRCENCGSYHALQIEHIFPRALGGSDDIENLKLLCRSCNQRTAIEVYNQGKMQRYLS